MPKKTSTTFVEVDSFTRDKDRYAMFMCAALTGMLSKVGCCTDKHEIKEQVLVASDYADEMHQAFLAVTEDWEDEA